MTRKKYTLKLKNQTQYLMVHGTLCKTPNCWYLSIKIGLQIMNNFMFYPMYEWIAIKLIQIKFLLVQDKDLNRETTFIWNYLGWAHSVNSNSLGCFFGFFKYIAQASFPTLNMDYQTWPNVKDVDERYFQNGTHA